MTDTSFRALVEDVRRAADVLAVVGRDVDLKRAGSVWKGLSPFVTEKTPSFVVMPHSGRWHDYAGGRNEGGDVFDFVQQRRGVSFVDAVLALAAEFGVATERRPGQEPPPEARELTERRELERALTIAAGYYHRALPQKIRTTWLADRYGFSDETIDSLLLGWADGHLVDFFDGGAFSREFLLKTGLFVLRGGVVEDFFRDRIVFPYWRGGRVVYFIARATEHTGDEDFERAKYKKLLTHSDRHAHVSALVRNDAFYNEDAARGADVLLITEGVTDCISAMQAGVACISPVTTRFRERDVPKLLELTQGASRIVICNDAEDSGAGDAGARVTAEALFAAGRDVRVATLPRDAGVEKVDLNEFLHAHGPTSLRPVLDAAVPYLQHLLDTLPKRLSPAAVDRELEPVLRALSVAGDLVRDATLAALVDRYRIARKPLQRRVQELTAQRLASARRAAAEAASEPIVQTNGRHFNELIVDGRDVLLRATLRSIRAATDGSVLDHASTLVFRTPVGLGRLAVLQSGAPAIQPCMEPEVFGALCRGAKWVSAQRDGDVPSVPPRDLVRDLISSPPLDLPYLECALTTPTFGRGGRLLLERGYHGEDGCWLEPKGLHLDPLPERPTRQDVEEALRLLIDDVLGDFPFAEPADRANCLAMLLLPFARRLFDGCTPIHLIEAPTPGTGKGLLAKVLGVIVLGRSLSTPPMPQDDDELRKRITAHLLGGDSIIVLDNVESSGVIAASTLAATITTDPYRDRILGRSALVEVPNRVTWVMTANNPAFNNDIVRRTIRIRLDAKSRKPTERRDLRHPDLLGWLAEHRAPAVRACLILVHAWIASGCAPSAHVLGSFEAWAKTLGGILQHAGVTGFLDNRDAHAARADVESEMWSELFWFWWQKWGPTPVRGADVAELCAEKQLLSEIRGVGTERSVVSRVGRALAAAEDRFFGQWQLLRNAQNGGGSSLYRLVRQAGDRSVDPFA